ncbi:hypothetical protein SAMN06265348_101391 [Pedobacter westerhofensis]|uniref:Thioredoxin n=1 Tax=Pedobacter westerhofensis TaxID=425512 RepID=A0A521ASM4_9SPHI|nr:thioredoxin [Pedobacter westerhofensis]SMO37761.1 hypothetical protein SAMN06265348_101391 [Pedobacter westerhofensis]
MIPTNCTRESILSVTEMKEKYDTEYSGYTPDPAVLKELKPLLGITKPDGETSPLSGDIKIVIVMGTWCSDSRLHVSHFYKIADSIAINENNISLICVDETKKAENGLTDHLNITSVPTFILSQNDREIGRIIETPENTLESDMVHILTNK